MNARSISLGACLAQATVLHIPPVAHAGGSYKWDGKYMTKCRPVAWRLPAGTEDPIPYKVVRQFNQYSRKVVMLSRGRRFDMGPPGRKISGAKNVSARWRNEITAKSVVETDWGLVKRYTGPARSEYRALRGVWVQYQCVGKRIAGS